MTDPIRSALFAALVLAFPALAQNGPPPADVRLGTAVLEEMAPQVRLPGTVVGRNDSRLAAQATGTVIEIAEVGTRVEAGDILARIDDRALRLDLARNESEIRRLEARLAYEDRQVERFRELAATNSTPLSRLEETVANRETVAEELAQARIALDTTRLALERSRLRAPFPGQVVERLTQAGEHAVPGREMLRLVDIEHVEIRARAPFGLTSSLAAGDDVTIATEGGARLEGRVRAVVAAGDEVTRTLEIRVSVADALPVGSAVEIGLASGARREVVAVPRDALVLRPGQTFIWTVEDNDTARRVPVVTGVARGDLVEVSGEVAPGARIVIRGGERLRPGQSVRVPVALGG